MYINLASTKFGDFVRILTKLALTKFEFVNSCNQVTIHFAGLASTGKTKTTKTAKINLYTFRYIVGNI